MNKYKFISLLYVFIFFIIFIPKLLIASQNKTVCPKEQLYLKKQRPVKINKNCALQSTFYFPDTIKSIEPLKPIINKSKTRLNIHKAKID